MDPRAEPEDDIWRALPNPVIPGKARAISVKAETLCRSLSWMVAFAAMTGVMGQIVPREERHPREGGDPSKRRVTARLGLGQLPACAGMTVLSRGLSLHTGIHAWRRLSASNLIRICLQKIDDLLARCGIGNACERLHVVVRNEAVRIGDELIERCLVPRDAR